MHPKTVIDHAASNAVVHGLARQTRDPRTTKALMKAVIHVGERILQLVPDDFGFDALVDCAVEGYVSDNNVFALHRGAMLSALLLESEGVGYLRLRSDEQHDCRALLGRHDAAEGPGGRLSDLLHK